MVALVLRSSVAVGCLFRSRNLRRLLLALGVIQGLQRCHGLLHWLSQRIVGAHVCAKLLGVFQCAPHDEEVLALVH